jgi:hypothetical protein
MDFPTKEKLRSSFEDRFGLAVYHLADWALTAPADTLPRCFLMHRTIFLDPEFLLHHKIPFNVALQAPGDLMIADGTSAREGWNTGNNLAAAVSYLDCSSIQNIWHNESDNEDRLRFPCLCGVLPLPAEEDTIKDRDGVYWYYPEKSQLTDTNTSVFKAIKQLGEKFLESPLTFRESGNPEDQVLYKLWTHFYQYVNRAKE